MLKIVVSWDTTLRKRRRAVRLLRELSFARVARPKSTNYPVPDLVEERVPFSR